MTPQREAKAVQPPPLPKGAKRHGYGRVKTRVTPPRAPSTRDRLRALAQDLTSRRVRHLVRVAQELGQQGSKPRSLPSLPLLVTGFEQLPRFATPPAVELPPVRRKRSLGAMIRTFSVAAALGAGGVWFWTAPSTSSLTEGLLDRAAFVETVASPATVPKDAPSTRTHVIKKGETLGGIAKAKLGDVERWTEIAALNPDLPHPSQIEVGEIIQLPRR